MPRRHAKHYHLSTEYLTRRIVMEENRRKIAAMVALWLEPYRGRMLHMHKKKEGATP